MKPTYETLNFLYLHLFAYKNFIKFIINYAFFLLLMLYTKKLFLVII